MTRFSAGDQFLGYLHQVRYALYLLLDQEDSALKVEGLDDLEIREGSKVSELIQLKHHRSPARLTDSCADLWKTLRVWCSALSQGSLDETTFALITTGVAPPGSIAHSLRPGVNRDSSLANQRLEQVAKNSDSDKLKPAFKAFLDLDSAKREKLLDQVFVLDLSPDIENAGTLIENRLKIAVARDFRDALFERLEGWWFQKVVDQLLGKIGRVPGAEVFDKIHSVASQFGPTSLPIDYLDAEPDSKDPDTDTRLFVLQLKQIGVSSQRVEKAIVDYYRAFEQRSRWAREDLLIGDELERYESKLVDEWERVSLSVQEDEDLENAGEQDLQKLGRKIYNWADQMADIRIRADVSEDYVRRGSFHMLANEASPGPRVWWHPLFKEKLANTLLSAGQDES